MIDPVKKNHSSELKNKNHEQSLLVKKRMAEIERIKKDFKEQELSVAAEHQNTLQNLKEELASKKMNELVRSQENLEEIKTRSGNQTAIIEKITQDTLEQNRERVNGLHRKNEDDVNKLHAEANSTLSDLKQENNQYIDNLKKTMAHDKQLNFMNSKQELTQSNFVNNQKASDQQKAFEELAKYNQTNFQQKVLTDKSEYGKELSDMERDHAGKLIYEKSTFEKQLEMQRKLYAQLMLQEREGFDSKLKSIVNQQNETINNISEKTAKHINNVKQSASDQLAFYQTRSGDPFYQTGLLNPEVIEEPQNYVIKIKVPEHEKDNVILHGDNRELRLTLTRRTQEEVTMSDGSLNKSNRSEVFIKKIPVKDIVDTSRLKQNYQNGMLSFNVPKK
jgi:HSP20 family molecular chaperone IbpA